MRKLNRTYVEAIQVPEEIFGKHNEIIWNTWKCTRNVSAEIWHSKERFQTVSVCHMLPSVLGIMRVIQRMILTFSIERYPKIKENKLHVKEFRRVLWMKQRTQSELLYFVLQLLEPRSFISLFREHSGPILQNGFMYHCPNKEVEARIEEVGNKSTRVWRKWKATKWAQSLHWARRSIELYKREEEAKKVSWT